MQHRDVLARAKPAELNKIKQFRELRPILLSDN